MRVEDDAPEIGAEFSTSTRPSDISGVVAALALLSLTICVLALAIGSALVPQPVWTASAVLNIGLIVAAAACHHNKRHS